MALSLNDGGTGFAPPSDVIDIPSNKSLPFICFNNCVRLQCPVTGLMSPLLVVRRVDSGTTVSAGEPIPKDGDLSKCPAGEIAAEPVCQLHKASLGRSERMSKSLYTNCEAYIT